MTSKISNLRVISLSEMLEKRYNSHTRYISAVVSCVYTSMIAVLQVIATGFFWRRATWQGAMASIIFGMATSLVVLVVTSILTSPDHVKVATWEARLAGHHPDDTWDDEVAEAPSRP